MQEPLNFKQAALILGVSGHTVRLWARLGRLPFYKLGRRIIFDRHDLDVFLQKNRIQSSGGLDPPN